MRKVTPLVLTVLLVAAAPAPTAPDLWYRHYEFGLRAIERSDWAEAIHQLEEAIQRRADPSRNARTYRMRFIDYFPYYHLGIAYYSMGDTERAREYFERELSHEEVQESDLYASQIQTMMAAVEGPRASAEVMTTAEETQRLEMEQKLQEGIAYYEARRYREAVSSMVGLLAVEPENQEAQRVLAQARRGALLAELEEVSVETPELVTDQISQIMALEGLDVTEEEVAPPPVEEVVEETPEAAVEEADEEEEPSTPPVEEAAPPPTEEVAGVEEEVIQEEAPPAEEEAPPAEEEAPPAEEAVEEEAVEEEAVEEEAVEEEAVEEEAVEEEALAQEETPPTEEETPPVAAETLPSAEEAAPQEEEEAIVAEAAETAPPAAEVVAAEEEEEQEEEQVQEVEGGGVNVPLPTVAVPVPVPAGGDPEEEEFAAEEEPAEKAPAEEEASTATAAAAASLESLGWTLFRKGKELAGEGRLEEAQSKFVTVLTMLQEGVLEANSVLHEEVQSQYDGVQSEIKRRAEAKRQAEIARLNSEIERLQQTKPEVAVLSPPVLDEPYSEAIVKVQGVVVDDHGVQNVEVEVNGQIWGKPELGLPTRNITVTGRGSDEETLGTQVNFHQDITLEEGDNEIVIRARNVLGLETEHRQKIRLEPKQRDIYAAVIGVSQYQDESIPDLEFAAADAEAFYRYLLDDMKVPEENVFRLMDSEVTAQRMREVLGEDIRDKAEAEDMVIIYYAGHGAPEASPNDPDGDGAEKYLVPSDASPDRLFSTAFSMSMVSQIFARLSAETILFISDACYSGAAGEGRTFGSTGTGRISDNYLRRIGGSGRLILSASAGNQLSHERRDLGHGVFTYHLLAGLRGPADTNGDDIITVLEAYDYVSNRVPEDTQNRQTPVLKGDLGGKITLARVNSN